MAEDRIEPSTFGVMNIFGSSKFFRISRPRTAFLLVFAPFHGIFSGLFPIANGEIARMDHTNALRSRVVG